MCVYKMVYVYIHICGRMNRAYVYYHILYQVPARNARSTRRAPGRQGSIVRTRVAQPARCQASKRLSRETLEFVFFCLRGFI